MMDGKTLTGFACDIGVHRDTIYEWSRNHSEFSDALKIARQYCQGWWEDLLRDTAMGNIKGNLGAQVFFMKNVFKDDWKDKLEYEADIRDVTPIIIEDHEGKSKTLTLQPAKKAK
jgi:hypothetical protein